MVWKKHKDMQFAKCGMMRIPSEWRCFVELMNVLYCIKEVFFWVWLKSDFLVCSAISFKIERISFVFR